MHLKKMWVWLSMALMLLCLVPGMAGAEELRGYEKGNGWQYAYFGQYPYEKDGMTAPVLWRILDVSDGQALLMTEYIIDTVLYHPERDVLDGPGLDYADTHIRSVLCTDVLNAIFTEEEQAVLVEMPGRGLLSLPSRRGELFSRRYGFVEEDFTELARRSATGTPYAFARGLRRINGNSWYWTTDWRTAGRRWIVGDNGHISVSGLDREGGIRPICYVRTGMLTITGGDGTLENPYQLALK